MKVLTTPLAIMALFAGGATIAQADPWNKLTRLTINETVQVPGATLTPGEYVVKLADSPSNRHIVRFMNEDQTKVLATVLAIPNQRMEPTGDTQLRFYETPAGEPPALRAWFYPGDTFGQQFVYPRDLATKIADQSKRHVPAMDEESAEFLSRDTKPDSDAPTFDASRKVYSSGPGGSERTLEEGFTEDEKYDRDPKWQEKEKRYGRYGRFDDSAEERSRSKKPSK